MAIKFRYNKLGYLIPSKIIKCSENEFKNEFIYKLDNFSGYGARSQRWNEYCDFISFIKKHKLRHPFKVWVYGSLVGKYKIPTDIDIILFFHKDDFMNLGTSGVIKYIVSNSKIIFNADCVEILTIPDNSEEIEYIEKIRLRLPCKSKDGKSLKGAIEIVYQ